MAQFVAHLCCTVGCAFDSQRKLQASFFGWITRVNTCDLPRSKIYIDKEKTKVYNRFKVAFYSEELWDTKEKDGIAV